MGTYRVIDTSSGPTKTYMGIVFRRTARVKKQVSLFQWVWLTVIEIIVGSELIESIVTTGSVQPHSNIIKEDSGKYGAELHLNLHIPAGFVMNALRRHLLQVLYYKFHWQYLILDQVGETHIDDNVCTINCTRTRFRAQKNLFYQFIALRRVYDFSWLIFNLLVDLIVYFVTNSVEWALLSAIAIEGFRRLLRV